MSEKMVSLKEALRAQHALRDAAGLDEQQFSMEEFVGMISDEIEILRSNGKSDDEIAATIGTATAVKVSAEEIGRYYAPSEQRHPHS